MNHGTIGRKRLITSRSLGGGTRRDCAHEHAISEKDRNLVIKVAEILRNNPALCTGDKKPISAGKVK